MKTFAVGTHWVLIGSISMRSFLRASKTIFCGEIPKKRWKLLLKLGLYFEYIVIEEIHFNDMFQFESKLLIKNMEMVRLRQVWVSAKSWKSLFFSDAHREWYSHTHGIELD